MKIILAGGGTGGPVIPLIAVQQRIKGLAPETEFLFLDAKNSPADFFAKKYGIRLMHIPAGKLRRYFSLKNLIAPFEALAGFIKAFKIIYDFQPDIVFGAGGYVSVPVIAAAYAQRKKILVHQQDIRPGLANKLAAPLADKITVSFKSSINEFNVQTGLHRYVQKVFWTGNPVRTEILKQRSPRDIIELKAQFGVSDQLPVIAVVGGGTGALRINEILAQALPEITRFAQVLHVSGKGKEISYSGDNYRQYSMIENMPELLSIADIVVARAGLSTISELSAMKKVSIIIPIPHSHQEDNALLLDNAEAALVLDQISLTPERLTQAIKELMYDGQWQNELKENIGKLMPTDAAEKIAALIISLCKINQKTNQAKEKN